MSSIESDGLVELEVTISGDLMKSFERMSKLANAFDIDVTTRVRGHEVRVSPGIDPAAVLAALQFELDCLARLA